MMSSATSAAKRRVIFINSHPIQYFAPLYKYLNEQGLETECWYCSDENVKGHLDRQFGTKVEWDIPLLDGYKARFFPNRSWKPSLYNGFFGLFNPGMIRSLRQEKKSIIVVHGWAYVTHIMVILFGRLMGHTICLRGESPLNQELLKRKIVIGAKKVLLGWMLFPFVHHFLYIGKQNRRFYEYYGVASERLVFAPYAVDNARFRKSAAEFIPLKTKLRSALGIGATDRVILFAAKLIEKKRPMDLLKAYQQLDLAGKCLVIVGDGELKAEVEDYVSKNQLPNVHLAGFVNQSEIPKFYAIADVFVLCSGEGETWGLSVNEALNFGLPVVVSDMAGCAEDLVVPSESGFSFRSGDVDELTNRLREVFESTSQVNTAVIDGYSYVAILQALRAVTAFSRNLAAK
jgi:glycosyltransferase involved in cell wall biosynthesis